MIVTSSQLDKTQGKEGSRKFFAKAQKAKNQSESETRIAFLAQLFEDRECNLIRVDVCNKTFC